MSEVRAALDSAVATGAKLVGALAAIKIIAVYIGPEGLGLVGHFMSVVAILTALCVGGTSLGVTRFVAESGADRVALKRLLGTASTIGLVVCISAALITMLCAESFSHLLFKTDAFAWTLRIGCALLIPLGFANLGMAVINGLSETRSLAKIQLGAAVVGVIGVGLLVHNLNESGAALGLLWMAACPSLLIAIWWGKHKALSYNYLRPNPDRSEAIRLMQYAGMLLITVLVQNITQIWIRANLEHTHGWQAAGQWQAMVRLSDAYLQVFNVYLVAYLLPRLVVQTERVDATNSVLNTYKFVLPLLSMVLVTGYMLKDFVIVLVLAESFHPVRDLFLPQMIGDFFKVIAFVPGYIVIARGYMPLYIAADPLQSFLLLSTNLMLAPSYGASGACWAYAISYAIYALLSAGALFIYRSKF